MLRPSAARETPSFVDGGGAGPGETRSPRWDTLEDPDAFLGIEGLRLEGSCDAPHPYVALVRLIDSLRHEDYFGIEGWRLGPDNVTIRVDLGEAWRLEFGYGRHVQGTRRSRGGLDDPAREVARKGRELPGMTGLGFSFTRAVR